MPFVFIIVGVVMLISGVKGTSQNLLTLLKGDFFGQGNFVYWFLSIMVIGALGYIQDFRGLSRAFLLLVLLVLILAENKNGGGVFTKFQQSLNQITGKSS